MGEPEAGTTRLRDALVGLRHPQHSPGCSAALSSAASGLRPNWFWVWPGKSNRVSAALTFSDVYLCWLRQFASTHSLLLAAGGNSGGRKPHFIPILANRARPKTHFALGDVVRHGPQKVAIRAKIMRVFFGGGKKEQRFSSLLCR